MSTSTAFDDASRAIVTYLNSAMPLGLWTVSRFDGEQQIYLTLSGDGYDKRPGDGVPWSETLCQYATSGASPTVTSDASQDRNYRTTAFVRSEQVRTYVGMPIRRSNGELFGTLCGIDPAVVEAVTDQQALFDLLARLLEHVLEADLQRAAAARDVAIAETLAETDALTGLLNRRGWDRMIALHDKRARLFGDPCAVLVADLDGLKQVNDTEGHDAGDELIRRTGEVLRSVVRGDDVIARLGGDEFGVLAGVTAGEISTLAARLDTALSAAGVSASVGTVPVTVRGGCEAAWKRADEAMYAAKTNRKLARRADTRVVALAIE